MIHCFKLMNYRNVTKIDEGFRVSREEIGSRASTMSSTFIPLGVPKRVEVKSREREPLGYKWDSELKSFVEVEDKKASQAPIPADPIPADNVAQCNITPDSPVSLVSPPIIEKKKPRRKYPCPVCDAPWNGRDVVQCDRCRRWHHYTCVKFKVTKKSNSSKWFCPKCKSKSTL